MSLFAQWCCVDTNFVIKDKQTSTLRFQISGATNNDLASNVQGLCGVKLKFKHKFIGDLQVSLTSPGGQKIELIGPNGSAGKTDLTNWNVSFVPCATVAVPDVGFKAKWSNLQNWGILGQFYNGTYYPYKGCLEDFDTGAVNGLWTLTITDAETLYDGLITSFCLLFCDNNGVSCNSCSANGGYFNQNTINLCDKDPGLNLPFSIIQPSFIPDVAAYGYKYFVFKNNSLFEIRNDLDFRNYSVGNFTICGVSYLLSDFNKLPSIASGITPTQLRNDLAANKYNACAEISKDCVYLNIGSASPLTNVNRAICKGESLQINGKTYDKEGQYNINLSNVFGCDSTVFLNLTIINLSAKVQQPIPEINCALKQISIDATPSIIGTNTSITWTTNGGFFEDLSNPLMPIISKGGTYTLKLSEGTCVDSTTFIVTSNSNIPSINLFSDTITCNKPSVNIKVITDAINPKYEWQYENNIIGNQDIIQVSQAGAYFIKVTDAKGCSNSAAFVVYENKQAPIVSISSTPITCRIDSSIIKVESKDQIQSITWSGPNNFSSNLINPIIYKSGRYTATVTGVNGCTSSFTHDIVSQINKPVVTLSADSLTCGKPQVQIINNYNGLYRFNWIGPGNFNSNEVSPKVTLPGTYKVMITDSLGCTSDTTINVIQDSIAPNFKLSADILGCDPDSVQIKLTFNNGEIDSQYSYYWSGPIAVSSNKKSPWFKEAGFYSVRVTGLNGCFSTDTISIKQTIDKPIILLSASDISCIDTSVILNTVSPTAINFTITGPNNYLSSNADPSITVPGLYKVFVTDANGCKAEKSILIVENRQPPFSQLQAEDKTCNRDSVLLYFNTVAKIDTAFWTGPNGFKSSLLFPKVLDQGKYVLMAIGKNGCRLKDSIIIKYDTVKPVIAISPDTLSCKKTEFAISKTSNIPIDKYIWRNPNGRVDTSLNYQVNEPGKYFLHAIGQNGCESDTSFSIFQASARPKIALQADTISCANPTASIILTTRDAGLIYQWTGPNNFVSNTEDIDVNAAGWYYIKVENRFGCVLNDSVFVSTTVDIPLFSLSDINFNCSNIAKHYINANKKYAGIRLEWTLPNSTVLIADSISKPLSGIYFIKAIDKNACELKDTITVTIDTTLPIIKLPPKDTINCLKTKISLLAESKNAINFKWTGPNNFNSALQNPIIDAAGFYFVEVTANNFCKATDNIEVISDQKMPNVKAIVENINCKDSRGFLDLISSDSLIKISWTSPSGILQNAKRFASIEPGVYLLVTEGSNHCLSRDTVELILDTIAPNVKASYELFPCNADSTLIIASSTIKIKDYIWIGPNQFFSTERSPYIKDTGIYELFVIGDNFCEAKTKLTVTAKKDYPQLTARGDKLTCAKDTVQIYSLFNNSDSLISWSGPNFYFNNKDRNPRVTIPGQYTVSIINKKFCRVDSIVMVAIDTVRPILNIIQLDSLKCENKQTRLRVQHSNSTQSKYQWQSSNPANIITPIDASEIIVNGIGDYKVTVINNSNGCSNIADIIVTEGKNEITGIDVSVNNISCYAGSNASIVLNDIIGGKSPFYLSQDGINYSLVDRIGQLKQGNYNIYVKDANGCKYDTLIQINGVAALTLNLGRDTSIQLGQTYTIIPSTNADSNTIHFEWLPLSEIQCKDCFTQTVMPFKSTYYKLRLTDDNGCRAEDDIYIKVNTKPNIYIPNIFSPNEDKLNDRISLSAGIEVASIDEVSIYDRWGVLIYAQNDFKLHQDEFIGWDGRLNGELCLPGVYVYLIKASLISGADYIFTGDVTLIR